MKSLPRKRWYVSPSIEGEGAIAVLADDIIYNAGGVAFVIYGHEISGQVRIAVTRTSSFYPYHSFAVIWHDEDYDPQHPDI
jgi:hypothetical protein